MNSPADTEDFLQHAEALVLEAARSCPPPPAELLVHMQSAARREQQLRARGARLSFQVPMDGPLQIELLDRAGACTRTLSAPEAIELACGGRTL